MDFKQTLDQFLSKVPDEPKADGLIPGAVDGLSGKQTNTLIYQVARRKVPWKDDDLVLAATITGTQMACSGKISKWTLSSSILV